jgi:apolipoprotein N-acyltransferase
VWAITFVVMLVAPPALRARARAERRPAAIRYALVSVALVVAPVAIAFPSARGREVRVAAIQVDVRSARSLSAVGEDIAVAEMNIELHHELVAAPPELAVWGEGSLDPGASSDPSTVEAVRTVIRT